MVVKKVKCWQDRFEEHLRRVCGRMSPQKRVIVVLVMFLVFTGFSLWITVSSIYQFGRSEGQRLQIQHIEMLELELHEVQSELESVKQFNDFNYDDDQPESE